MQHPGAIVLLDEAPDDVSRLFRRLEKGGVDHVGVAALDDEPALSPWQKSRGRRGGLLWSLGAE